MIAVPLTTPVVLEGVALIGVAVRTFCNCVAIRQTMLETFCSAVIVPFPVAVVVVMLVAGSVVSTAGVDPVVNSCSIETIGVLS